VLSDVIDVSERAQSEPSIDASSRFFLPQSVAPTTLHQEGNVHSRNAGGGRQVEPKRRRPPNRSSYSRRLERRKGINESWACHRKKGTSLLCVELDLMSIGLRRGIIRTASLACPSSVRLFRPVVVPGHVRRRRRRALTRRPRAGRRLTTARVGAPHGTVREAPREMTTSRPVASWEDGSGPNCVAAPSLRFVRRSRR
jgi:hypothetical protein